MLYVIIGIVIFYIICFFVSIFNSEKKLHKLYNKYMNIKNNKNYLGKDVAFLGLEVFRLDNVKVAKRDGVMTDAYSPKKNILIMSEDVCNNNSIASCAIVAHELGHAVQDKNRSILFLICNFLQKFCNIFSKFALPLLAVGLTMYFCEFYVDTATTLIISAIVLLFVNILQHLLQIPLEKNASELGFNFLKDYDIVERKDYGKVKKILNVAGKTYMANFFRQLNPFKWRWVIID